MEKIFCEISMNIFLNNNLWYFNIEKNVFFFYEIFKFKSYENYSTFLPYFYQVLLFYINRNIFTNINLLG